MMIIMSLLQVLVMTVMMLDGWNLDAAADDDDDDDDDDGDDSLNPRPCNGVVWRGCFR